MKTHLRNVRSKTGLTKLAAARALADAEARPPLGGSPTWGRDAEPAAEQSGFAVHDTRAVFEFEPRERAELPQIVREERINTLNTLPRLVLIGVIAVVFGMMLLQSLTLLRPAGEVGQAIRPSR